MQSSIHIISRIQGEELCYFVGQNNAEVATKFNDLKKQAALLELRNEDKNTPPVDEYARLELVEGKLLTDLQFNKLKRRGVLDVYMSSRRSEDFIILV